MDAPGTYSLGHTKDKNESRYSVSVRFLTFGNEHDPQDKEGDRLHHVFMVSQSNMLCLCASFCVLSEGE